MTAYTPPKLYFSPHIETIVPALFRRVRGVNYRRERLETDDGDFLDLDWLDQEEKRPLAILCHGLEGDSARPYVKGMARAFSIRGYDVLAWNYRGCSGEMNRLPRFYHSGATDDVHRVVQHAMINISIAKQIMMPLKMVMMKYFLLGSALGAILP